MSGRGRNSARGIESMFELSLMRGKMDELGLLRTGQTGFSLFRVSDKSHELVTFSAPTVSCLHSIDKHDDRFTFVRSIRILLSVIEQISRLAAPERCVSSD